MPKRSRERSSRPARPARRGRGYTPFPTYDELDPRLADAVRSIVNQHELDVESLPKSIAVISGLAGEGVTTIARTLSLLIAHEMGASVCLVDCSWMVDTGVRTEDEPAGMFELMTDRCTIDQALRATGGEPKLMSLGPGNVPPNRRHVLARSAQFERLIDLLCEELDHVVFDTPPMLQGAAGLSVLRHADSHVLVVRNGITTIPQVRAVVEKVDTVPQLGMILNQYRSSVPDRLQRLITR